MFVAETRPRGPEIVRMSTGLSELRMLFARRGIVGGIVVSVRFERSVKALVIDMLGGRKGALLPKPQVQDPTTWV
jgi:hypothetical protein